MADHALVSTRTLGRSLGPTCSNVCSFSPQQSAGVMFSAHAVADGTIIIQQVWAGNLMELLLMFSTAIADHRRTALELLSSLMQALSGKDSEQGLYAPVLLMGDRDVGYHQGQRLYCLCTRHTCSCLGTMPLAMQEIECLH